jgi:uncharacterized GH25 family protein
MPTRVPPRGRATLILLVVVALAAVAYVLAADPFGGGEGGAVGRGGEGRGEEALGRVERGEGGAAEISAGTAGLQGLFGEGDLGAVRFRLLRADTRRPLAGQRATLRSRGGTETAVEAAEDGTVLFSRLPPGRGYQVEVRGTGFKDVALVGVAVVRSETTDLGDVLLGENVVLRGRVVDVGGKPVPAASVAVYAGTRLSASDGLLLFLLEQATKFPDPVERTLTDDRGWFALSSLRDGVYRLEARHEGYATKQQPDVVVSVARPASTLVIRLGDGARMRGRVVDDAGRPVAGAKVVALRDMGARFSPSSAVERDVGLSDADGRYVIDTLTQGASYRMGVLVPGYAPLFDTQATEVAQELERDFTVTLGGVLAGRVLDAVSGGPVEGAQVLAVVGRIGFGGRGGGGQGDTRTSTTVGRTNAEGRFRLEGMLPGPVAAWQVRASGHVMATANVFAGSGWPDVEAGKVTEVEVRLERGGVLTGSVRDAASGQGIPGATVSAIQRGGFAFFAGSPSTTTDAEGGYRIEGVPAGDHQLTADAPGYAPPDAADAKTVVKMPEEGGTITLDLALSAAGTVHGVVTDTKGEPVAGARVRTVPAREDGGRGNWSQRLMQTARSVADLSDQQGRFRLEGVGTTSRWILEAESDGYVTAESEAFKVGPGDAKELNLVLVGGGALSGRVVDENGRWVAGARVRVGPLGDEDAARASLSAFTTDRFLDARVFFSDSDGKFFAPNLKPGRTLVKAEHPGFVTFYKRNAIVRADEVSENYVVALSRGVTIEGIVKGADLRPLPGAFVAVTSQRNPRGGAPAEPAGAEPSDAVEPSMNGRSDADGRFEVENVPPGTWSVVVWFAPGHKGYGSSQDEAAIRRDVKAPATDVEFRLTADPAPAGPPRVGPRPGGDRPPSPSGGGNR